MSRRWDLCGPYSASSRYEYHYVSQYCTYCPSYCFTHFVPAYLSSPWVKECPDEAVVFALGLLSQ
ncbi:MAG TPA: hypothetical protein VM366_03555 [Anaerolineae bacterium]|nr:hypothetical protein [Anaerolineae bacterium]